MLSILKALPMLLGILSGLPQIIQGVELAFSHKPKSGSEKWIAVETALSGAITSVANTITANSPSDKVAEVAADVSKWVKAVNDATVTLYNKVGWPTPQDAVSAATSSGS